LVEVHCFGFWECRSPSSSCWHCSGTTDGSDSLIVQARPNNALQHKLPHIPNTSRIQHTEEYAMDKDRIKGSAEQAKGAAKAAAGKVLGDSKLEAEGKADKAEGKIRNAVGGLKDSLRGK
jgi:uncharacterized protein YjbJ (UPF0337 family)